MCLHGLQAVDLSWTSQLQKRVGKQKGTVIRQCLVVARAYEYAREPVPYVQLGANVRGSDAAPAAHRLSCCRGFHECQVNAEMQNCQ